MISTPQYTSETKPNGFTKKCRDCNRAIYLHRGNTDRWRAFETEAPSGALSEEWVRHRCPAGLQDAELMSLIAPAGAKLGDLSLRLKQLIEGFEEIIAQVEARQAAALAAAESK